MKPYELFKLIKDTKYKTIGRDVDYQITVIDGRPCLLFQESTSDQDWKTNFDWIPVEYKNFKAHRGFVKAWKSGRSKILKEFCELVDVYTTRPLIAGWSFGGAMCVLAAEDFFSQTGVKADLISFGAPMVTYNKASAEYVESCCNICCEYSQRNDCVALCPPVPGFYHLNRVKLGDRFSLIKVFNPGVYHQEYDNKSLYKE